jgi:ribonuclease T2
MTRRRAALVLILVLLGVLVLSRVPTLFPPERSENSFDYYALVLSWMPAYCATEAGARDRHQCGANASPTVGLHGLWPQYERGWPSDCQTQGRSWVPQDVIDDMAGLMPTRAVIHQYRKHGTCSGLSPERYFDVSRQLFHRISIPDALLAAAGESDLAPAEIEQMFLAANPWLEPEMIAVDCQHGGALSEIRLCFTPALEPRACGANENERRLCPLPAISVPAATP